MESKTESPRLYCSTTVVRGTVCSGIRYAFERMGSSAMEFLDMEKFTSILCLFVVCLAQ